MSQPEMPWKISCEGRLLAAFAHSFEAMMAIQGLALNGTNCDLYHAADDTRFLWREGLEPIRAAKHRTQAWIKVADRTKALAIDIAEGRR
ncbi:hypothetical protein [Phenylobacterium sp.]|uniref:hypothetical protein n=1 Tax=Phenylobacterium sp. TaxID=1871053 RepID=UPI002FDEC847